MSRFARLDRRLDLVVELQRTLRAIGETFDEYDSASAKILLGLEVWSRELALLASEGYSFERAAERWEAVERLRACP